MLAHNVGLPMPLRSEVGADVENCQQNWIVGHDSKMDRFRTAGMISIDEDFRCLDSTGGKAAIV